MAAPGEASRPVRLGIASYSFREFSRRMCIDLTKRLTPLLTIKEFHALYRSTPEELDRAKAEFAKAGIVLTGGGTVYMLKDDPDDVKFYFDYAKRLGLPMMNIGPTAKSLPIIEKFAKQYDIKIAIHNHGPEDKNFPAPSSMWIWPRKRAAAHRWWRACKYAWPASRSAASSRFRYRNHYASR